jgi:hypothetical protein
LCAFLNLLLREKCIHVDHVKFYSRKIASCVNMSVHVLTSFWICTAQLHFLEQGAVWVRKVFAMALPTSCDSVSVRHSARPQVSWGSESVKRTGTMEYWNDSSPLLHQLITASPPRTSCDPAHLLLIFCHSHPPQIAERARPSSNTGQKPARTKPQKTFSASLRRASADRGYFARPWPGCHCQGRKKESSKR